MLLCLLNPSLPLLPYTEVCNFDSQKLWFCIYVDIINKFNKDYKFSISKLNVTSITYTIIKCITITFDITIILWLI